MLPASIARRRQRVVSPRPPLFSPFLARSCRPSRASPPLLLLLRLLRLLLVLVLLVLFLLVVVLLVLFLLLLLLLLTVLLAFCFAILLPLDHAASVSAGVVKKPKTEFQEHIQMAKALSKSLVAAIPVATPDPENEEVTACELFCSQRLCEVQQ